MAPDPNEPQLKKFVVVQIPLNPRMVLANESGDPNQDRHLVYVGINTNFVIGDALDVAPYETQKEVWRFVGTMPTSFTPPAKTKRSYVIVARIHNEQYSALSNR
jgi:hypothetical protein